MDAGAEAAQLGHVHEPLGKHAVANHAAAVGQARQGRKLGLQVGGNARIGGRREIDRPWAAARVDADFVAGTCQRHAGRRQARRTCVPNLGRRTRGSRSTCYARVKEGARPAGAQGNQELATIYHDFYREHPFVRLAQAPPATKHTLGNNQCLVYPVLGSQARQLVVISCLDNLVKGAAGQAVQNMNLMFDLPEDEGLNHVALYP